MELRNILFVLWNQCVIMNNLSTNSLDQCRIYFPLFFKFKIFIHLIFLSWKFRLLVTSAAYIQVNFRQLFIMKANTMNPDQTVPSSDTGFILFVIKLPKLNHLCSWWQILWHMSQFSKKIRYNISWESSSRWFSWNITPLKKQQNLKLSSAANYRWHFMG